jgi:hypothetical protein
VTRSPATSDTNLPRRSTFGRVERVKRRAEVLLEQIDEQQESGIAAE